MVTAAFFDVDRTILDGSSLLALARPLRHEGFLPLPTVLRAAAGQLSFTLRGYSDAQLDSAAVAAATAMAGVDAAALRAFGTATIPTTVMPRVYREAQEAIAAHRAAGRKVFLVSSAPRELIEELGRILGVDGVAATIATVDASGRYTGEVELFCHGAAKTAAVQRLAAEHGIDLSNSYAYGDSMSDAGMLASVGHPVAVNADSRLRAVARERGWMTRSFSHRLGGPVRLHELTAARRAGRELE